MWSYIRKLIFFLVPVFLMIGFNCWVDSANLISGGVEEEVSQYLLAGKHVANIYDHDERLVQKKVIAGGMRGETIVLGSSRGMQFDQDIFSGSSFYNFCVSASSLQDIYGISFMLKKHKSLPKELIFVADPWLFNKNNKSVGWYSLKKEYELMAEELGVPVIYSAANGAQQEKYKELVNPTYFQENFRALWEGRSLDVFPTENTYLEVNVELSDGSLIYEKAVQERSHAGVVAKAKEQATAEDIFLLGKYEELDPILVKHFEELMGFYRKEGIAVTLFLAPFNPLVWEVLDTQKKYQQVLEAQEYFTAYAQQHQLPVWGAYDPSSLELAVEDFYDGVHLRRESIHKLYGGKPITVSVSDY